MAWYLVCLMSILAAADDELPHKGTHITMQFEVMRPCEDFPNGDVKFSNLKMEQIGKNEMSVSGQVDVKVPIDERFNLQVRLIHCISKSDRGNCETFPPTPIPDVCKKLADEDQIWSGLVHDLENFTPKCPVPPGSYEFHHHKLRMDSMPKMPLMVGYWIIKTEGFLGDNKVMCELSEMSLTRKKNKKG
ncbi:uncharacterized protein [Periplaneta americana]|uniref:uncharacterized protein isoform X2 n=1 Tax=Periplaneta americana TaxID=6978 RepID=UPI0037E809A8